MFTQLQHIHTNLWTNSKETCLFHYIQYSIILHFPLYIYNFLELAGYNGYLESQDKNGSDVHGTGYPVQPSSWMCILCVESGTMGDAPFFQLSSLQTREQLPRFYQMLTLSFIFFRFIWMKFSFYPYIHYSWHNFFHGIILIVF